MCSVVLVNLCGVTHHGDLGIICAYYFSAQLQKEFLQVMMTMKTYLKAFWVLVCQHWSLNMSRVLKAVLGTKGRYARDKLRGKKIYLFIYFTNRSVCWSTKNCTTCFVWGSSMDFLAASSCRTFSTQNTKGCCWLQKKNKKPSPPYLPLITKKKIKSEHSSILPNPSVLAARKPSATMKGGFHKQWPLLPAGQSNSSRHLTRSMSSHRETESSASVKSSGGLQGADRRRRRDLIRSQVVELFPPRPSETNTGCTKCAIYNVMSPHVSPASALQVSGDMVVHRGGDGAQRRKWLMCVSYPRHQSQFGSSAKIWIKLALGGLPTFLVSLTTEAEVI